MKTSLLLATLLLTPTLALADDKAELTALLSEFLDGATRNDAAIAAVRKQLAGEQ